MISLVSFVRSIISFIRSCHFMKSAVYSVRFRSLVRIIMPIVVSCAPVPEDRTETNKIPGTIVHTKEQEVTLYAAAVVGLCSYLPSPETMMVLPFSSS